MDGYHQRHPHHGTDQFGNFGQHDQDGDENGANHIDTDDLDGMAHFGNGVGHTSGGNNSNSMDNFQFSNPLQGGNMNMSMEQLMMNANHNFQPSQPFNIITQQYVQQQTPYGNIVSPVGPYQSQQVNNPAAYNLQQGNMVPEQMTMNMANLNMANLGNSSPHAMMNPQSFSHMQNVAPQQSPFHSTDHSSNDPGGGVGLGGGSSHQSPVHSQLSRRMSSHETASLSSQQQQHQSSQQHQQQNQQQQHTHQRAQPARTHSMPLNISSANQTNDMAFAHANMQDRNSNEPSQPAPLAENRYPWVKQSNQQNQQSFTQNVPIRRGPQPSVDYTNAYSSTGFDMLTILMRVATRKNPEINIGAVDMSCAFVVCDANEHDIPIVYCSENFERLTGYTKHEILGRNCRFLQAPDGKVQAGLKRSYVDDDSVLYLKNMITSRKEAQVSIINYRKGGQPFMNLLTMIPITYETDEFRFFVGFQVDLVEQPNSVTNKNPDGTYTINYQRGLTMPRYVFDAHNQQNSNNNTGFDAGHTVARDDVSTVLSTMGTAESELSRRLWDKVLLENTDDVVIVLSLKGLFLYLSPSASKILQYEPSELQGTALSAVCHPSDIVPVTRELKDNSTSAPVNIVFRIRRKINGFMWFEGYGSLHTEQGKGRKSVILVGRERPVYTLSKTDIVDAGGIGDNEVWTKLSTSGMFLFVSSSIRSMLDRQPQELIGTSMQALMRQETRPDFMRILDIARAGKKASCKHELINKRGQVLQAFSTVYPGDAAEGAKPTFVIAQTRLIKYNRTTSTKATGKAGKQDNASSIASNATPSSSMALSRQDSSMTTPQHLVSTLENPTTFAGQHGMEIGHQDVALASDENLFDELKTTRSTSWQFELRQMEKRNRLLAEELQGLLAARKKRKRRKGPGQQEKDCANCHTRVTPEWRRGPSGNRDLCNSCGLRWAKQQGRISPRTNSQRSAHSQNSDKQSVSPRGAASGAGGGGSAGASNSLEEATGNKSIDETLAEASTKIDRTSSGVNGEKQSPGQMQQPSRTQSANSGHATDQSGTPNSASSPAVKMTKMEISDSSPQRRYSIGVPTKIEEEDDDEVAESLLN